MRYLLFPGEEEGGERRRATDFIWSLDVLYIDRIVVQKDEPVLYYLTTRSESVDNNDIQPPKRSFVREELQVVPANTEIPLDFVLKR